MDLKLMFEKISLLNNRPSIDEGDIIRLFFRRFAPFYSSEYFAN